MMDKGNLEALGYLSTPLTAADRVSVVSHAWY